MPDAELRGIYFAQQQSSCGCAKHYDLSSDERSIEEYRDWQEAVFSAMEDRGFSIQEVEETQPLTCPGCGNGVEVTSGECGDMFAVCTNCQTYRQFGDHMDCSFGPVVTGTPIASA